MKHFVLVGSIIFSALVLASIGAFVASHKAGLNQTSSNDAGATLPAYDVVFSSTDDPSSRSQLVEHLKAEIGRHLDSARVPKLDIFAQQATDVLESYAIGSIEYLCDTLRASGLDEAADSYLEDGSARYLAEAGMATLRGLQLDTSSIYIRRRTLADDKLVADRQPYNSITHMAFNQRINAGGNQSTRSESPLIYELLIDASMTSSETKEQFHGTLGLTYFYDRSSQTWIPVGVSVYDAPPGLYVVAPPI